MSKETKLPYRLSMALAALMVVQTLLGLLLPDQYRDADWIKATWFGNDWVTLVLAVPLLVGAAVLAQRGSVRGQLVRLGVLGYAFYNFAYYLFGAALNAFLPIYVGALVLSAISLIVTASRTNAAGLAASFRAKTPVRLIGGYLVFVGTGLASIWLMMWAGYIFAGRPTPVEPEAFKVVAAIDLSVIVTLLVSGGILLWRRNAWGYLTAASAGILSTLYLLVLSVNSLVAIQRGLAEAPGELPIWGTLALFTAAATLLLLANAQDKTR